MCDSMDAIELTSDVLSGEYRVLGQIFSQKLTIEIVSLAPSCGESRALSVLWSVFCSIRYLQFHWRIVVEASVLRWMRSSSQLSFFPVSTVSCVFYFYRLQ